MHDMKEKLRPLTEMEEMLTTELKCHMDKGLSYLDTGETGQIIDMIKDLAEAKKDCMKALYYETVVMAMQEHEDEPRYGYNVRRYADGMPYYLDPNLTDPQFWGPDRPGYSRSQSGTRMSERPGSGSVDVARKDAPSRYGYSFDQYEDSKKKSDKDSMDRHAKEHLADTVMSMKEIWASADANLKKKMKADLTALVNEMAV